MDMGFGEIFSLRGLLRFGRLAPLIVAVASSALASAAMAETAIRFTLDSRFAGPATPFLLAVDRGYYRNEKLAVTIVEAPAPLDAISRVASGAYDMGFADINLLIRYRDQNPGTPVKAVFMVYNKPAYAIVSRKSRDVSKPRDLEDKKLGAPGADIAFMHWKLFAQVNEIDTSRIAIENVGFPVREPLLQNGQVDAVVGLSYTVVPNLKSMGLQPSEIVVLSMADHGVKLYGNAIIVNPKFAAEKPEAVKAFLQAFVRGLKETVRNSGAAVESTLGRNDAASKEVELDRLRMTIANNILTPEVKALGYGAIDAARLDQAIDQIAANYEFKTKPKAGDIFDASFLPAAPARKVP
jgi:NitT/TauT family transport system substrate-binding protein